MMQVRLPTNYRTDVPPPAVEVVEDDAAARRSVQRPEPGLLRWIDVCEQTPADMELLAQGFRFHPLALEDCLHVDQRPKLEEYPGPDPYLFVVIHSFQELRCSALAGGQGNSLLTPEISRIDAMGTSEALVIQPQEVHAFLGAGYLVTVHEQPIPALEVVWRRVATESALLCRGTDFAYYLLADALCDSNFPVLERMSDLLDDVEEAILSAPEKRHLHRVYEMRKLLVTMRRVLSPQRDLLALLSRHGGSVAVQAQTAPYFRDVYDHLVRINEGIESGRDLLGNCVDAYLSAVGQRTNEIMKQLTILSAVMLPLTFLSGFFGMNFEAMPFKSTPFFVVMLVLMLIVIPAAMVGWFRHKHWL